MMVWMPFIYLGIGVALGFRKWAKTFSKYVDTAINAGLIILMLTLGAKIGSNDSLINSLSLLGFRSLFTAALAISFSVIFTVVLEKTVLPLEEIRRKLAQQKPDFSGEIAASAAEERPTSPLVWVIPGSITAGIVLGYWAPPAYVFMLDYTLGISLAILYVGVGISFGLNKKIFQYIRLLGWRIILLPAGITAGSLAGGLLAAFILGMPSFVTLSSAGGMSYYSLTGAFLTQTFGIEVGAYGFLVNVAREFLTVLLLPLLIRISKGSPIAAGACGTMDTMLVPVTKFVGIELGLVALISGTILTILVPLMLPVLVHL